MDDFDGKRPAIGDLVTNKYLPSPQSLLCPEDKTGNWGQLVQTGSSVLISWPATGIGLVTNNVGSVNYSYLLQPLTWDDAEWLILKNNGSQAGVAACQLHGLGNQNTPDVRNYSGLLLRAQLDGSVIRRQFFWSPLPNSGSGAFSSSATSSANLVFSGALDPLQIFFDNPACWQDYQ